MTLYHPFLLRPSRRLPAFTMAETLVSILIVGGVLVAALNAAGASATGQQKMTDRARGALLAADLMSEIMAQEYQDPGPDPKFGAEAGESLLSRLDFDDVDDFHGLIDSPLLERDGKPMPSLYSGWLREVVVELVDPNNLKSILGSDGGAKRITVTVKYNGVPAAALVSIRTSDGSS